MENLTKEVEKSNWIGCIVGGASAVALEWVRRQEVERKGPRQKDEHDVEQATRTAAPAEYQTLNADSDSDEDIMLLDNDDLHVATGQGALLYARRTSVDGTLVEQEGADGCDCARRTSPQGVVTVEGR